MKAEVTVNFGNSRVLNLAARLDDGDPQAAVLAHQWLEQTYEALGAEPVRASGKVLLLDRILAIAMAAGYQGLSEDPDLAEAYARHTAAAVGRARVIVDVAGLTVGY
ncbi:hypothetical protein IMZ29_12225 [Achromobacter sp. GG226]|uniref:hypothetical protein n=1 Tax=Verticiella alkaliphila TaxID=2779529 RepID=UPI001C0C8B1E|nr:hypothetical protein [Verticiella sp. GG226]MBU4611271.1 hypothetical protein [Verticiella sp. GG226]